MRSGSEPAWGTTQHATRIGTLAAGALLWALAACGGNGGRNEGTLAAGAGSGGGGSVGGGGNAGTAVGGGNAGSAGGSDVTSVGGAAPATNACEGVAPAPRPQPGRLDLPVKLTIGSTPAVVGATAAAPNGREFQLGLLKLFLTQPVLLDAAGQETPGQIVGADGQPSPYGLQLIDLDDATTQTWRIVVAEGSYSGLRFGVGVPQGCNPPSNTPLVYPLNPDSEMFWPWGGQFMFVRVEGMTRASQSEALGSFAHHVGFDAAFAHIMVSGTLNVSGISSGPTLVLDVARMLATDAASLPAPQHAVPDGWVADNLERDGTFTLQ
jgi:hypothetical protein